MEPRIDLNPSPSPPPRRRGFWRGLGYLLGGPVAAVGVRHISDAARFIRGQTRRLGAAPPRDWRILAREDGALDLRTTALLFGTTEAGIERMLRTRRRQTARATAYYLAGSLGFLALWLWEAALTPSAVSLSYLAALLATCVVFFLFAFKNALMNWQARSRRLGTVREFLATDDRWWPS